MVTICQNCTALPPSFKILDNDLNDMTWYFSIVHHSQKHFLSLSKKGGGTQLWTKLQHFYQQPPPEEGEVGEQDGHTTVESNLIQELLMQQADGGLNS